MLIPINTKKEEIYDYHCCADIFIYISNYFVSINTTIAKTRTKA